jgi:hypothetical protein
MRERVGPGDLTGLDVTTAHGCLPFQQVGEGAVVGGQPQWVRGVQVQDDDHAGDRPVVPGGTGEAVRGSGD